jgi:hypothetical protein
MRFCFVLRVSILILIVGGMQEQGSSYNRKRLGYLKRLALAQVTKFALLTKYLLPRLDRFISRKGNKTCLRL